MINWTNVLTLPVIDFGTLTDPTDLETLVAVLRSNRAMMIATSAMQQLGPVRLSFGATLTTDQELRKALRGMVQSNY